MPNVELIQRVLDYITVHPEEWNQQRWETCFAGTTVRLSGDEMTPRRHSLHVYFHTLGEYIASRAMMLLDLSTVHAMRMFSERNTLADLYRLANEFTGGAIEVPAEIALGKSNMDDIQEALSGVQPVMMIVDEAFDGGTRVTVVA